MANEKLKISGMSQANAGDAYVMVTQDVSTTPITRRAKLSVLSDGTIDTTGNSSTSFSSSDWKHINGQDLIAAKKIKSSTNLRFANAYRSFATSFSPNGEAVGGIVWRDTFFAMLVNPFAFGNRDERLETLNVALEKAVVKKRTNSTVYKQYSLVQFVSGNVYWVNIAGQSSNTEPTESGSVAFGDTLTDGTAELTFTGYTANPNWENYLLDYANGLEVTATAPQASDSYVGTLVKAIEQCSPSNDWLLADSTFVGKSRIELLEDLVNTSIINQLNNTSGSARLPSSLQNDGGRFLANACEAFAGVNSLAALFEKLGDTVKSTEMKNHANDILSGIFSLYDAVNQKWRSYLGQVDHISKADNYDSFSSHYQYLMWPIFFGAFDNNQSLGKEQTLLNILSGYTTIFSENSGEFPNAFPLFVMGKFYGIATAYEKLAERVFSREPNKITLSDSSIFASASDKEKDSIDSRLTQLESGDFFKSLSIQGEFKNYLEYTNVNAYTEININKHTDGGSEWARIEVKYAGGDAHNLMLESDTVVRFKNAQGGDISLNDKDFVPEVSGDINLGTDAKKFKDLFTSGIVNLSNLPTSDPGVTGQLWNSSGTLRISQ